MRIPIARSLMIIFVLTIIFGSILFMINPPFYKSFDLDIGDTELRRFSSIREMSFYIGIMRSRYESIAPKIGFTTDLVRTALTAESSGESLAYSETNVQVEGVDEPDIIKTDGEYIYLVKENRLFIIYAYPPEESGIVNILEFNGSIIGIFVNDDKLVVFLGSYGFSYIEPRTSLIEIMPYPGWGSSNVTIFIYDISVRENPIAELSYTIEGSYVGARMIDNYVYLVSHYRITDEYNVTLPIITIDNEKIDFDPNRIAYTDIAYNDYMLVTITAINIVDKGIDYDSFLFPSASTIYVSHKNIYVTTPDWEWSFQNNRQRTRIFRIAIEGINVDVQAHGAVPGMILNQFSMDEYNNYFRIATTESISGYEEWYTVNNVYVLNMSLDIVGRLEGLAGGEMIYSVRFIGDIGYVVTFKKVDPLFIIDLSDPLNPEVRGKLKIPGYSSYLHPVIDGYLIGVGKEAVPAEEGDFAWYQGIKISLFSVEDLDSPIEIDSLVLGDRGSETPVLYDHKALQYYPEKGLLMMPVLIAIINPSLYDGEPPPYAYGEPVWQGLVVIKVTRDGITLIGNITHIDSFGQSKSELSYENSIVRAMYIGDYIYTFSSRYLMVHSLIDFQLIKAIPLE
jgi:uncharacterized secreted protein with C-terminal beta-propeller domain